MTLSDQQLSRLSHFARWLFIIAVMALWVPLSWQANPNSPGTHVDVGFGAIKPLQATWESSSNGFWFGFSDLRAGAFLLSVILTAAAIIAAREMDRKSRIVSPAEVLP